MYCRSLGGACVAAIVAALVCAGRRNGEGPNRVRTQLIDRRRDS